MSKAHYLQGAEQEAAQKAQVLKLPEQFEESGRSFFAAWRSKSTAIYSRSAFSGEHTHLFCLWTLRTIGNTEWRGELLGTSENLDALIDKAVAWENSR
jgi:hypothetical protein